MVSRTRKLRGSRTHGRGKKHGRGAGGRGGTGNAGLHKHKFKSMIKYDPEHFGRHGFTRHAQMHPVTAIDLEDHVQFRTKMFWVLAILVLYFAMTNVFIYGLDRTNVIDFFSSLRAILAGAQGSLMHLGIGPIVTASIIMQLFAGAKIINLNLQDDEDKSVYQGTQKFLVIVMIFVEAVPQVFGFLTPASGFVSALNGSILFGLIAGGHGDLLAKILIILQLFGGSYLVFLMAEAVSTWGLRSGISLFIAGGVAEEIFTGPFNWEPSSSTRLVPAGTIPQTRYYLQHASPSSLAPGGVEEIQVQPT